MPAPAALLVDLDGVVYVEDRVIPGAPETVAALRAAGVRLRFVTDTTSRPRRSIVDRLARLGFAPSVEEVLTLAALAVEHCRAAGRERVALLMNEAVKPRGGLRRSGIAPTHTVDSIADVPHVIGA